MNFIARISLRILTITIQSLPLFLALKAGELLGIIGYYFVPKRKRTAFDNLKHAFPEKSDKEIKHIIKSMAKNLGRNMMEFLRLPKMTDSDMNRYIEFEGLENLDKALSQNKGAFILTAHFGNWDLVAASMAFKGYQTNLVTKYLKSELLNSLWLDFRKRVNVNIFYREGSLKNIIKHLRENEIIGFVLDQNTKREEGVFVNFFGRPACTIPSLATLSQRLEAPVIPCFSIRKKGGYHKVILEPAIPFTKKDTMEESIVYNTQVYTNVIERYIRQYPDHWIWLHRRWKTQPK
jgi:KDO2-lipid IV(A) lauroyltransferase